MKKTKPEVKTAEELIADQALARFEQRIKDLVQECGSVLKATRFVQLTAQQIQAIIDKK